MLTNRLISVFILVPIIIFILFFSSITQLAIFMSIICLISAWEWSAMMQFSKKMRHIWMIIISGSLYTITKIIISQNNLCFNPWLFFFNIYTIVIIWWITSYFLILSYPKSAIFWSKSKTLHFCFGALIILPFFGSVLILREFYYINNHIIGTWWLLYIVTLIWINDSIAYFVGQILGKYKLSKNVSPNKTWEGCIGGVLISSGIAYPYSKYILTTDIIQTNTIFICSISAIIAAIIGDLIESMFKREKNIKDTGNLIPGHGGMLDRIDSLSAAIPIFTYLVFINMY